MLKSFFNLLTFTLSNLQDPTQQHISVCPMRQKICIFKIAAVLISMFYFLGL